MWQRLRKIGERLLAEVDLRDVFCFGGLASAAYGASQVYGPAGWILVGVTLFWLGVRR